MLRSDLFALTVAVLGLVKAQDGPIIDISTGSVQGSVIATHYDINVHSFYGIPFGQPTNGSRRFERPLPALPWDGVFEATSLPSQCIQSSGGVIRYTHPWFNDYSEDCLNVNVFTPANNNPTEPYPVMVWFYGGAFQAGGNIQYPGHFLAARDVVVVVVNYRVGLFGFMNTRDDTNPGNSGLYDQALALEWVQENIAAFGGNPDQVTIFGQSAGSASCGLHTVSPVSRGLFHAVIEESGTDTNFWSYARPASNPWTYPQQVAEKCGCPIDPPQDMYVCLQNIEDPEEIRENSGVDCTPGYFCLGHVPVIDGEGNFLPDEPLRLREQNEFADVPLMSGWNAEDGSLYVIAYIPESLEGGFNRSEFEFYLYDRYISIWEDSLTPKQAEDAFWAVNFQYTPWPYLEDEEMNRQAFVDMTTDAAFGIASDRQLKMQSRTSPAYQFIFGYRSTNTSEGIYEDTEWAGVPHSGEIPYVWGWPLLQLSPEARQDIKMFIDIVPWNEVDYEYAEFTMDLFTNFAKYFDPTPEPVEAPLGYGPISWPALTEDELNYMWIHIDDVEPRLNYRQKDMAFWREYMSYLTQREIIKTDKDDNTSHKPRMRLDSTLLQKAHDSFINRMLSDFDLSEFDNLF